MIEWPRDNELTETAKANLARFRITAGAKALEEDPHTWRFLAWARSEDPPQRMILRNETQEELAFTFEETGTWIVRRKA